MDENKYNEQITSTLKAIHALLIQTVDIQQIDTEIDRSIHDLEKKQTETASDLLEHAAVTNTLAGHRTDMAKERTALVREQTRLSTKSTELSDIRTQLSHERTALSGQRTNLSVLRTDFSRFVRTGQPSQAQPTAEGKDGQQFEEVILPSSCLSGESHTRQCRRQVEVERAHLVAERRTAFQRELVHHVPRAKQTQNREGTEETPQLLREFGPTEGVHVADDQPLPKTPRGEEID